MFIPRLLPPKRFGDDRGWFTETYSAPAFAALGITATFVQDNHSYSAPRYTLRGMHCQTPPRAQDKLVRCVRGSIFDVVVDVRKGSPTYGKWAGTELSAENGNQLFVPTGFLHGFLTLEDDCEVIYKCSDTYAPDHEAGVCWADPAVGIDWPIPKGTLPHLSSKDTEQPLLSAFDSSFVYDGGPLEPIV